MSLTFESVLVLEEVVWEVPEESHRRQRDVQVLGLRPELGRGVHRWGGGGGALYNRIEDKKQFTDGVTRAL